MTGRIFGGGELFHCIKKWNRNETFQGLRYLTSLMCRFRHLGFEIWRRIAVFSYIQDFADSSNLYVYYPFQFCLRFITSQEPCKIMKFTNKIKVLLNCLMGACFMEGHHINKEFLCTRNLKFYYLCIFVLYFYYK